MKPAKEPTRGQQPFKTGAHTRNAIDPAKIQILFFDSLSLNGPNGNLSNHGRSTFVIVPWFSVFVDHLLDGMGHPFWAHCVVMNHPAQNHVSVSLALPKKNTQSICLPQTSPFGDSLSLRFTHIVDFSYIFETTQRAMSLQILSIPISSGGRGCRDEALIPSTSSLSDSIFSFSPRGTLLQRLFPNLAK